tara:strand:+ start:96 stop:803 length:708 start_codon:yes stop_codon:yes gene_type:complete
MAIRRPPTTFSDTISTADIADDAISGDKLANDIAISTTGNIATTGSGTLTVAGNSTLSGTNNLGSNPTVTLGANTTFPSGHTLQIVNHTNSYNTDVSSTTYAVVDSASGVDWEPQIDMIKSTSKLLAIFSLALVGVRNGGPDGRGMFILEQNINSGGWSTAVSGSEAWGAYDYGNNGIWNATLASIQHYTFPNTTGIVKYRLRIRCTDSSGTVRHGGDGGTTNRQSQVTFIEIQG